VAPVSHVNSSVTVTIRRDGYSTHSLSLAGGDSVGFTNVDNVVHRVELIKPDGALIGCTPNPVTLLPGEAGICYFETPGTFTYLDQNNSSSAFRGTITVIQCCTKAKFLTTSSATFPVGVSTTFVIRTSGVPHPTITASGTLPGGLQFTPQTQGMATISGKATGTPHQYSLALSAANAGGSSGATILEHPRSPNQRADNNDHRRRITNHDCRSIPK